jgi:retron-type reverse transcriptase
MPKRYKDLFDQIVLLENLFAAARKAMRGKRGKTPAAACFADLEKVVVDLRDELVSGSWRPGDYYYFTITDPKEREVAAAPFRDRIVHHALVRVLEALIDPRFIEDSFACRKGKGTHAAMARAQQFTKRYRYCLKCDIQKYFPSMDHVLLRAQIERVIADPQVLEVVDHILASHVDAVEQEWPSAEDLLHVVERPRGLPIGNLTSQFFANIYLHPLDLFVKHDLRVKGYVRYVDDFLLFGDDRAELKAQGRAVREYVQSLRLRMHPDKYRFGPTECGVDFVGFVMYPDGRVRMRDANVRRFERRFKQQAWTVRRGEMELADLQVRTRCWIAHASHAQSYGLRKDLFKDIELWGHREMNNRGLRGGSFNNNDTNLQSSNRNNNNPTNENNNIGFRVSSLRKAAPA